MALNSAYAPVREAGTGSKVDYDFDFEVLSASDLSVGKILNSTNVKTTMVLGVDYTVTLDQVTRKGTVTYTVAPTILQDSWIGRAVDLIQTAAIPTNNVFREVQMSNALDRGMMVMQQLEEQIGRALKLPDTSTVTDLTLPEPTPGRGMKWNPAGDGLINTDLDPDAVATEAADSAAAAAVSETNAGLSEAAAAQSETNAGLSEAAAAQSETNAGLSEAAAVAAQGLAESARDLAQNYANALKATSTSSNSIGTGAKNFTTQAGKQFIAGQFVVVVDAADAANYMVCQVTSYTSTSLVLNSLVTGGSGTKASWDIAIAGSVGPTGATGATGAAGADGADGTDGLNFMSGTGAPDGSFGVVGDLYLNFTTYDIYKKTGASTWTVGANIKGATGATGAAGADGIFSAIASQAEAEAGTENTKGMTALRVAQAIDAQAGTGGGSFISSVILSKTGTATLTADDRDKLVICSGSFALTLPAIVDGHVYKIQNIGDGIITIVADGTEVSEVTGLGAGQAVILVGDATNDRWRALSRPDVILSNIPAADHDASGIKIMLKAHENVAFGDVCYINADGEAQIADADAIATSSAIVMAAAAISANANGMFLLHGIARDDTWNWTVGGTVYLSVTGTTGNTLSQAAPTGTDDVTQVIGIATHADRIFFNPSLIQIEHV